MDGPQQVALAPENNAHRINQLLRRGIDCGVKSPFKLSLTIPKEDLRRSHQTNFYDLQQMDDVQVGLSYDGVYRDVYGVKYSRIWVCIKDLRNNRQEYGVRAEVMLNGERTTSPIKSFGEKHPQAETFHFRTNLGQAEAFINDEKNKNGLEIIVAGYVFYWDEDLMDREHWRFGYGVRGYSHLWRSVRDGTLEFIARDGTILTAHFRVLRRTNALIATMQSNNHVVVPGPIQTPYHADVIKAGLQLLYSYRLVGRLVFAQKLELLLICNEFQMFEYKQQLEEHLSEYIDAAEIGKITRCAIYANAELLKERCLEFVKACFRTHTFFLGLEDDDVALLIRQAAIKENWPEHWDSPPFQQD